MCLCLELEAVIDIEEEDRLTEFLRLPEYPLEYPLECDICKYENEYFIYYLIVV